MNNRSSEEQIVDKVECKNIITNAVLRSLIYLGVLVSVGVILTLYKTTGKVNYLNSADVNYVYVVVACVLLSAIFMIISILSALHKKAELNGTALTIYGGVLQTTSKTINVSNIKNVQFSSNKFCTKLKIEYVTNLNLYTENESASIKNANHTKLQNERSDKENQNLTSTEGVYSANSKTNELTQKESEIPQKETRIFKTENTQIITLTDLNNLDLLYTALNSKHITK